MKLEDHIYIMKILDKLLLEDKYLELELDSIIKRDCNMYQVDLKDKNGYPAYQL